MIRDTSAQDRPLSKPRVSRPWRRWLVRVVIAAVVAVGIGYVVRGWLGAERSVDRARIRIAQVARGTLVRDVVADGRVVAANSPMLYAIAPGMVDFHVRPGDKVVHGQSLATVASPDLQSRLLQEQATLAGLEASVGRAGLDVEHGKANAQKLIAQAEVDRQGAAREVEINNQMFAKGVIPSSSCAARRTRSRRPRSRSVTRASRPGCRARSSCSISGPASRASIASARSSASSSARSPRSS